jgi:hypothetical protein
MSAASEKKSIFMMFSMSFAIIFSAYLEKAISQDYFLMSERDEGKCRVKKYRTTIQKEQKSQEGKHSNEDENKKVTYL